MPVSKPNQTPAVTVVAQFMSLLPNGFSVIIAGGAARDLMLGQVPNDFDLWVSQDVPAELAFITIENVLKEYRTKFDAEVTIHEIHDSGDGYNGMGESDKDRGLDFVFKLEVDGVGIDIIKLRRPEGEHVSPAGVVSTFDFPCNQFWIAQEGIIGIGHMQQQQEALRPLRDERVSHMNRKLPMLTFTNCTVH